MPPSTTVPALVELPITKAPVEVPILPLNFKVSPEAAAKELDVPAVNVTSLVKVAVVMVPVSNKVPPPSVRPPVALLILLAALMESVPPLMVVPPV